MMTSSSGITRKPDSLPTREVDSAYEKERALSAASRVLGVVEVNGDALTVIERARPKTDEAIEEDIRQLLIWSPYVDAEDVTVRVRDGIATVTGTVDTSTERKEVLDNVLEAGARAAKDNMNIRKTAESNVSGRSEQK